MDRYADRLRAVLWEMQALSADIDLLDQAAADRFGVNRTDLRCLDLLGRRGPLTAGQLAEAAGLSTGAATTAIDRLERAGYARRRGDPADRRRVVVEFTDAGRYRSGGIFEGLLGAFGTLLEPYSDHDLALIRDFLASSRVLIAQYAAAVRTAQPPVVTRPDG